MYHPYLQVELESDTTHEQPGAFPLDEENIEISDIKVTCTIL